MKKCYENKETCTLNPKGKVQPIRIRYGAKGLIGRDLFKKHDETVKTMKTWGFTVTAEKISRIDMQVMLLCDITDIITPGKNFRNKIVCTAQKCNFYFKGVNGNLESFTMGNKKTLQICTYDKRAEMFNLMKSDPEKFSLMIQESFGNEWLYSEIPTTRVEFRIGRELLESMKINTMEDLVTHENGLARYCCNSWFRITSEPKKRGHTHEQQVSDKWKEVQDLFEKYFPGVEGHNEEVKRTYDRSIKCTEKHFVAQGTGCFASLVALRIGVADTANEVKSILYEIIRDNANKIFHRSRTRAVEACIRNGKKAVDKIRETFDHYYSVEKRRTDFKQLVFAESR